MLTFGRAITETYKKESLKSQETVKGLALNVRQKVSLIALRLLADAVMYVNGNEIRLKKGGKVVVREEDMHNGTACGSPMTYDKIKEDFLVVEGNYIVGYEEPGGSKSKKIK